MHQTPVFSKNKRLKLFQYLNQATTNSYTAVSLLNSLSKIFERVIKSKLVKTIFENNIIPNEHFGFRSQHNTLHQIARICRHVKSNLKLRNPLA